jgi:hypothetical protein
VVRAIRYIPEGKNREEVCRPTEGGSWVRDFEKIKPEFIRLRGEDV